MLAIFKAFRFRFRKFSGPEHGSLRLSRAAFSLLVRVVDSLAEVIIIIIISIIAFVGVYIRSFQFVTGSKKDGHLVLFLFNLKINWIGVCCYVENSLQVWHFLIWRYVHNVWQETVTIIEIIDVIIQVDFLNKTLLEKLTDFITSLIKLGNLGLARALRFVSSDICSEAMV